MQPAKPRRTGEAIMRRALPATLVVAALTLGALAADDLGLQSPQSPEWPQWPMFRGTQAGAVADDPALPDTWSETENIAWKTAIPGVGWSSPVVWDDHVFVTASIATSAERQAQKGLYDPGDENGKMRASSEHRFVVYDVDFKTGRIRWQRELIRGLPRVQRHLKNSFASETPVTDGERVYVYFGSAGVLAAMNLDGRPVWTTEIAALDGRQAFGTAASPALYKDRVIVVHDNAAGSFMAAFNSQTGTELWRVQREEAEGWSTPFVWEHALRTEIVTSAMNKVRSYDLDGRLLWELKGMTVNVVPTPFAKDGLLYVNSGYPGGSPRPVYAIRPGASGDITLKEGETSNQYIVWYQPLLGTYNTSSLVYGRYYYTLLDRGFLLCHDAKTGQQIYGRQRLSPDANGFTASPWAYNGKIFLLSEDGDTFVVQAGTEYRLLGKNTLNEMSLATPAIVRGSVFLRTQSQLYRITKQSGQ
ncbi:MAG: serine/threonine protein kinase [Acidobacteria bacterium]|nr:serine/threonine protein kinase [Acidobacteriota bacterium]